MCENRQGCELVGNSDRYMLRRQLAESRKHQTDKMSARERKGYIVKE